MDLARHVMYDFSFQPAINLNSYPWNTPAFTNFRYKEVKVDGDGPPMDIGLFEAPDGEAPVKPFYVVALSVAGYNKGSLRVNVRYDTLEISCNRIRMKRDPVVKMISNEIFDKDFRKTLVFGSPIEVSSSKVNDGILFLTVDFHDPKSEVSVKID